MERKPRAGARHRAILVNGLRDSGLVGIPADTLTVEGATEGPNARLIRTSRYSNLFFLDFVYNTQTECLEDGAFTSCDATRDIRHKLLRAEGALNRFLMVSNFLESEEDDTSSKLKKKFRNSPIPSSNISAYKRLTQIRRLKQKAVGIPMSQLPRRESCGARPIAFLMSFA